MTGRSDLKDSELPGAANRSCAFLRLVWFCIGATTATLVWAVALQSANLALIDEIISAR